MLLLTMLRAGWAGLSWMAHLCSMWFSWAWSVAALWAERNKAAFLSCLAPQWRWLGHCNFSLLLVFIL